MTRAQATHLLNSWRVETSDEMTDEYLEWLVSQGKPANAKLYLGESVAKAERLLDMAQHERNVEKARLNLAALKQLEKVSAALTKAASAKTVEENVLAVNEMRDACQEAILQAGSICAYIE